jgi:hypothetical protein
MSEQEQWFTSEERKTLLKERYFTSTHHYFFEVKEANNGTKYIVIDQRKKVGNKFVGAKMRIFEDELLEFERVFHKLVHFALNETSSLQTAADDKDREAKAPDADLSPTFFEKLSPTGSWGEFEKYTCYLLKLLGIQTVYSFFGERQAGKADGFFKVGNLAVMYDCTLDRQNVENSKREQLNNYCNRLSQGSIEI